MPPEARNCRATTKRAPPVPRKRMEIKVLWFEAALRDSRPAAAIQREKDVEIGTVVFERAAPYCKRRISVLGQRIDAPRRALVLRVPPRRNVSVPLELTQRPVNRSRIGDDVEFRPQLLHDFVAVEISRAQHDEQPRHQVVLRRALGRETGVSARIDRYCHNDCAGHLAYPGACPAGRTTAMGSSGAYARIGSVGNEPRRIGPELRPSQRSSTVAYTLRKSVAKRTLPMLVLPRSG